MIKRLSALILLAGAFIIFFTWSKPFYDQIKGLMEQKDLLDQALANTQKIQELKDGLVSQYSSFLPENIDRLDKALPSSAGSMNFILEIDSLLQKNGMVLKGIDIKEIKEDSSKKSGSIQSNPFNTVTASIKALGSYKSFYSFLYDVVKNLRLSDVSKIGFVANDKDFYDFSMDINFYYLKK